MMSLPTLNQCLEICEKNKSFKYKKEIVEGYEVYTFNYFLASYTDFVMPFEGCEVDARELRGLTFVIDGDKEICFPFIHKFFNINENPSTLESKITDIGIRSILTKYDGSAISFIKFPNGVVRAKTKYSFESEQAKTAQSLYESDEYISRYVNKCFNINRVPLFELVSPFNKIVCDYDKTELRPLHERCMTSGEYAFSYTLWSSNVHVYDLLNLQKTVEDEEGWVIILNNGEFIKIKTLWYFAMHKLLTDDLNNEAAICSLILDEKIDDILSQIPQDSEKALFITDIQSKLLNYITLTTENVIEEYANIINVLNAEVDFCEITEKELKRLYVMEAKKTQNFYFLIQYFECQSAEFLESVIVSHIRKNTNKVEKAKAFLTQI
jgi:T4 RnlA family RNA ligase